MSQLVIYRTKSLQKSPVEAAKELLRRRRARSHLIDFARYTHNNFIPAPHHFLISEKLEAVIRGEITRLMINMPPRHGKSELASLRFPAYFLGKYPERSIIAASYNSELAGDFGRGVRNIINDPTYNNLFDVKLAADSQAAGRWHTDKNGGYVSAGVGTAITGRGAHILLIDDPFKDRAEADSETIREKTYNWYMSTAYTRLEGSLKETDSDPLWRDELESGNLDPFEGAVIVINTRWHEDDLSGRLLADMEAGGDKWEVLSLPAISADGKALWPGKYPIERLKQIRKALPRREWEALYQQEPTPDDGTFFRREWFDKTRYRLGDEPKKLHFYQSSDYATIDEGGDFTEFGIFGVDADKNVWVKDWWYGQETTSNWISKQLDQLIKYPVYSSFGESGVIRRAVEPFQLAERKRRKVYCRFEWLTRTGDKTAMAISFQGMAEMGMIHIPYCHWGDRLIDQLVSFPAGKFDDAVDVCALFGMAVNSAHPAILDTVPDEPKHLHNATLNELWALN